MLIALKIDRKLLDESRVFIGKPKPNGHTPEYYDLLLNVKDINKSDDYGNIGFISQSVTKEERIAGTKLPILGNAKLLTGHKTESPNSGQGQRPSPPVSNRPAPPPQDFADDDQVPF